MAVIIRGKSKCSVCGKVIDERDQIVATSQFITDANDPLWKFSNTAMHKRCFLGWDRRSEFIDRYNQIASGSTSRGATYHRMERDGSFSTGVGEAEPPGTSGIELNGSLIEE